MQGNHYENTVELSYNITSWDQRKRITILGKLSL